MRKFFRGVFMVGTWVFGIFSVFDMAGVGMGLITATDWLLDIGVAAICGVWWWALHD